jgi:hypothetical protein
MTLEWSALTHYRSPPARKRHSSHRRGSALVLTLTSALVCALKHSVSEPVIGEGAKTSLDKRPWKNERGVGDHCGGSPGVTEIAFSRASRVPISGRREGGVSILRIFEGSPIESPYELTNDLFVFRRVAKGGCSTLRRPSKVILQPINPPQT